MQRQSASFGSVFRAKHFHDHARFASFLDPVGSNSDLLGSSLWLLPPPTVEAAFSQLTRKRIPSAFGYCNPLPILAPHITLTSGIPDSLTDSSDNTRREWFDSLPLALNAPPVVSIQSLAVGDRVTQKITLLVQKEPSLVDLAVQIRAMVVEGGSMKAAQEWAKTIWMPHISLLYADAEIGEIERSQAKEIVQEIGIALQEEGADPRNTEEIPWTGAKVLWVDTRKDIQDWTIIAERPLPI